MNAKAVVFITCRLLAIYLMVFYVLNFVIQTVSTFFVDPALRELNVLPTIAGMALATSLYGLIALFLWVAAGLLSKLIAAPFPEKFTGDMDLERWQAVVVMALGGIALINAAALGGEVLRQGGTATAYSQVNLHVCGVFTVLGLSLIVFARQVVAALRRSGQWLSKPFVETENK
jgi:hypothetical protein